jgi:hypothetical protein
MMRKNIGVLIIGLVLLVSASSAQKIEILETGSFHGEEVGAVTGEMWLGLYKRGENYTLLPSTLIIGDFHDEIVDGANEMTGKKVTVAGAGEPLLLLKGGGFLQGSLVKTVHDERLQMTGDFDRTYEFENLSYRLKIVSDTKAEDGNNFVRNNSKLVLSAGKTSQVLYAVEECDSCFWQVNWIGDLDGDGKLDFYLYLSDHYNVANQKLFLSSEAEQGDLVKEVGEFTTTGC